MHLYNFYSLRWLLYIVCLLCISNQTFATPPKESAALIIGNHYNSKKLKHIVHDAEAIVKMLENTHDFEIFAGYNLNREEMIELLDRFYKYLPKVKDVIFVYLGMYGVQTKKTRHDPTIPYFLLPTNNYRNKHAKLSKGIDITRSILKDMVDFQRKNRYASIIVLDTCHNNHPHSYQYGCAVPEETIMTPDNSIIAYTTNNKIVKNRTYTYDFKQSLYITNLIQGIKIGIRNCDRINDIFKRIDNNTTSEGRSYYRGGSKIPYFHGCPKLKPPPLGERGKQSWTLQVTSNVIGAQIFFDFERIGYTTPKFFNLPPDCYTIWVEKEGYRLSEDSKYECLRRGERKTLHFNLIRRW